MLGTGRRFTVEVARRSPRWAGQTAEIAAWRWGLGPTVLLVQGWEGRVAFDHADAIVGVAAAVGPLHAIVAHSFGAAAALLAFERGGVDAQRNVLIAPNVLIDDSLDQDARLLAPDGAARTLLAQIIEQHSSVTVESLHLDRRTAGRDASLLVIHDRDDREVAFAHDERLPRRLGPRPRGRPRGRCAGGPRAAVSSRAGPPPSRRSAGHRSGAAARRVHQPRA